MKRTVLIFLISALVIASCVLWYMSSGMEYSKTDALHAGVIILVVAFAVFLGFKRLGSAKRGEPAEDEMSKKVLTKTASLSYYISLYLWVVMIYVKDRLPMDTEEVLGTGILGMAVVFAGSWLFYHFKGIKSE